MILLLHAEVGNIRLIVDLDQHICVALAKKPLGYVVGSAENRTLIGQMLILTVVEEAKDRHHSQFVRLIEYPREARQVVRP